MHAVPPMLLYDSDAAIDCIASIPRCGGFVGESNGGFGLINVLTTAPLERITSTLTSLGSTNSSALFSEPSEMGSTITAIVMFGACPSFEWQECAVRGVHRLRTSASWKTPLPLTSMMASFRPAPDPDEEVDTSTLVLDSISTCHSPDPSSSTAFARRIARTFVLPRL